MITAFEALLLPACMAVLLGLAVGFGVVSLIQVFESVLLKPTARPFDEFRNSAVAPPHARGLAKPAGCGRTSV